VGYLDGDGGRIDAMEYLTRGRERPRHWFAGSLAPALRRPWLVRYRRRHRRKTGAPASHMAMTMIALAATPTSTRMTARV
jgi:hypothetical protein